MPRDGSGTFTRSVTPPTNGAVADADDFNAEMDDIATALTASINASGTKSMGANLPMGGFKLTGLAAGSANGDSVRYEQVQPFDATLTALAGLSTSAGQYIRATGTDTFQMDSYATVAANIGAGGLPRSSLAGLGMANNATDPTNDIDFAAGACRDSTNAADITCSALTKRLDATWAAGTGNGGLDTGSIANTTYHCFAIKKDSDGSGDFLFSTSATAPTMPSGYTYFRRVGSIVRASAAIRGFVQDGDWFSWKAGPIEDVATNIGVATAQTLTLSVPVGIRVNARLNVSLNSLGANTNYVLLSDLSTTDISPTARGNATVILDGVAQANSAVVHVMTNTSAQIRGRGSAVTAQWYVGTIGYIDTRGKDA